MCGRGLGTVGVALPAHNFFQRTSDKSVKCPFLSDLSLWFLPKAGTLPLPLIHTPVPISNLLHSFHQKKKKKICFTLHSLTYVFFSIYFFFLSLIPLFSLFQLKLGGGCSPSFSWRDQSQSLTKEGLVTENKSPPTQPLTSRIY